MKHYILCLLVPGVQAFRAQQGDLELKPISIAQADSRSSTGIV